LVLVIFAIDLSSVSIDCLQKYSANHCTKVSRATLQPLHEFSGNSSGILQWDAGLLIINPLYSTSHLIFFINDNVTFKLIPQYRSSNYKPLVQNLVG